MDIIATELAVERKVSSHWNIFILLDIRYCFFLLITFLCI